MNIEEIQTYLSRLSNEELSSSLQTAILDLQEASESAPDSEWHQSCFAGVMLYSQELSRRKIH